MYFLKLARLPTFQKSHLPPYLSQSLGLCYPCPWPTLDSPTIQVVLPRSHSLSLWPCPVHAYFLDCSVPNNVWIIHLWLWFAYPTPFFESQCILSNSSRGDAVISGQNPRHSIIVTGEGDAGLPCQIQDCWHLWNQNLHTANARSIFV